jgi:hypothetical protein
MLYLDLPTLPELRALAAERADACVAIYLPTTPLTQDIAAARIAFDNLGKAALAQLEAAGLDKRRRILIAEQLDDLAEADAFWRVQANSLAVLVTPDVTRTFRLPNALSEQVQVSDRFHLKPLLRAVTFPHEAFVLALGENAVRLVEVPSEGPATTLRVADMPKSAADATGRATVNDRSPSGRVHGSEGQKTLLRMYARAIDTAVRGALAGRDAPLILAATEPLASIYRSVCSHPRLAADVISGGPDQTKDGELADAARPILDGIYRRDVASFHDLFAQRAAQGRMTLDPAVAARAATHGMIDQMLIDMDVSMPGDVDEETGAIQFAAHEGASTYSVTDEIACRALLAGARVMSVRADDIPNGAPLAAILRYAFT